MYLWHQYITYPIKILSYMVLFQHRKPYIASELALCSLHTNSPELIHSFHAISQFSYFYDLSKYH